MTEKEQQKQVKQQRKLTHRRVEIELIIAQYKAFEKTAKKEKVTPNKLIKNMAIAYHDTKYFMPTELKESLNQLSWLIRNIADNVNQIAHRANLFKDIDEKAVFQHLADLDKEIKAFIQSKVG